MRELLLGTTLVTSFVGSVAAEVEAEAADAGRTWGSRLQGGLRPRSVLRGGERLLCAGARRGRPVVRCDRIVPGHAEPDDPAAARAGKTVSYDIGDPGPGQCAPDFTLPSTTDGQIALSRLGKTVLSYFQEGLMCQPC